ncbi:MAG: uroporphyrinogen decarboxylase family protein [Candidatus Humimicrobiaceae bacterium]
MNARDKFNAVMSFDTTVGNLKTEYGYWSGTVKNFIKEGMPVKKELPLNISDNSSIMGYPKIDNKSREITDENVKDFFNLDPYIAKFPFDVSPMLPESIIEEDEYYKIYKNKYGITLKERKDGTSAPLDLDFPIKDRKDFENYKQYYDLNFKKRSPENWNKIKQDLKNREFPVRLGGNPFGFLGFPRHLIGTTNLFIMMYDNPQLIKDFNEFFLNFIMSYWSEILDEIQVDCILIFEDMCYKNGSMISDEMFKEFLSPYYKRLIKFLKKYEIKNIIVDSDGYVENIIPLFLECGVTGLMPFEIQAGNDLLRIRKNYPGLQILGGIDKKILRMDNGKAFIDRELEKVPVLLKQGGYIPHIDHHVSEDATWENFKYYRKKLNYIIDNSF